MLSQQNQHNTARRSGPEQGIQRTTTPHNTKENTETHNKARRHHTGPGKKRRGRGKQPQSAEATKAKSKGKEETRGAEEKRTRGEGDGQPQNAEAKSNQGPKQRKRVGGGGGGGGKRQPRPQQPEAGNNERRRQGGRVKKTGKEPTTRAHTARGGQREKQNDSRIGVAHQNAPGGPARPIRAQTQPTSCRPDGRVATWQ